MRIAVPRSCLSQPRWVRVGFMFAVAHHDGTAHADDALLTKQVSTPIHLTTRRLHRG